MPSSFGLSQRYASLLWDQTVFSGLSQILLTQALKRFGKNKRIGLRSKVTETRAYRIDNADHYICLSLLLLRSILFYIVYLDDSALLQCRIGLISEVIVKGIYSDQHRQCYMTFFQSLFSQFYPLIFFQNVFALVSITFFTIKNI